MKLLQLIAIGGLAILFSSCQSTLPPSGFLGKDDARMTKNKSLPFGRSWKNSEADLSKYSLIAVQPMRTDRLRSLGKGLAATNVRNIGDTAKKDATELAAHATNVFQKTLDESPGRQATLVKSRPSSKDAMILETNLVEAVPGKPAAQVLNFFVPFTSLVNRPTLGVEGRLVDAKTGETLFAFSDRERSELSLLDARKFTYYGVHRREIGRLASQLRKVIEGNAQSPVGDAFPIQPIAW